MLYFEAINVFTFISLQISLSCQFVAAVLVWLNYKNAYEYWTEQRLALNREVQTATHQLLQKLPLAGHQFQHAVAAAAAPAATGTLFLQLTVEDLGICLPMNQFSQVRCIRSCMKVSIRYTSLIIFICQHYISVG